jgi:membrane protease YdiL (CAAX protease family)
VGSLWHGDALEHVAPARVFHTGMPHQVMPMISTLVFIALFGLFMAYVFHQTGGSVLATILAHLSLNIASVLAEYNSHRSCFGGP